MGITPTFDADSFLLPTLPPPAWRCDCFAVGNGMLVLLVAEGEQPNAWYRFWQRILVGNKWTRIL